MYKYFMKLNAFFFFFHFIYKPEMLLVVVIIIIIIIIIIFRVENAVNIDYELINYYFVLKFVL